jgi:hypothetical protein
MTTGPYLAFTGGARKSSRQHPGFTVYEGGKGKPATAAVAPPMLLLTGPSASDAIRTALAPPPSAPTTHGYDAASYHTAAIDEAAAARRGPQPNAWIKDLPATHPEW